MMTFAVGMNLVVFVQLVKLNIHYFSRMILVTGGTGLLGAHLLYKLAHTEEKVRAIYRNESKLKHVKQVFSCYTDDYDEAFDVIEWIRGDILDIPSLSEAFVDVNYVYHCAAFVSFEPDKYQLLRQTNIEGTANVVNFCISHKIKKLCYVSSIATLGTANKGEAITEETAWDTEADNSVYAITKYGAEMEVWRGTQEGLDTVIVNPGVILGGGIWHYGTGSFFKRAQKGIGYYTKGTIGLVSVEDVVSVMISLTESEIKNKRFILVAENWTYKKFLQAIAISVKAKPPKKEAASVLLAIAWRIDWLVHKLTGKRRALTKHIVRSLSSETNYSSEAIKKAISYKFKSIAETITTVGYQYLK